MNSKLKVLTLTVIVVAAVIGGSLIAMQSIAKANSTTPVASAASDISATPSTNATDANTTNTGPFLMHGFGGGFGRDCEGFHSGPNMFDDNQSVTMAPGFGGIQVSAAFTQNVTSILNNSTDVQTLISQGYNVTSIRPIITTTLDGNGNLITQATSANVVLVGTNGRAIAVVSLTQDKVTKLVTITVNNDPA